MSCYLCGTFKGVHPHGIGKRGIVQVCNPCGTRFRLVRMEA